MDEGAGLYLPHTLAVLIEHFIDSMDYCVRQIVVVLGVIAVDINGFPA